MRKARISGVIVSNDEKWIYDLYGIENCAPRDILKVLEEADGEGVVVEINSGGGDLFAASEIYSALERHNGDVITDIVGAACSAASIIAMAGDPCRMSTTAAMMIHNVSTYAEGDCRTMEKTAETLGVLNRTAAAAYRKKTGREYKELLDMMADETWMTAERAKELGFADEIYGEENNANRVKTAYAACAGAGLLPKDIVEMMFEKRTKAKAKLKLLKTAERKEN